MINNDGIYLYNSELTEETLKLNISSSFEDVKIAELKQFSLDCDGYIIIILQEKLFFFTSEGNYYHDFNLSFNSTFYSLVPFKKSYECLYYIIGGNNETKYNLYYYKFNLNTKLNEEIYTNNIDINTKYNADSLEYTDCILMVPSNTNKNILTCIYSISLFYSYIKISNFDIDDNLIELTEYDSSLQITSACNLIFTETSENKNKALFFCLAQASDYVIFDIDKKNITTYANFNSGCDRSLKERNKFYYFPSTKEYFFVCKEIIMIIMFVILIVVFLYKKNYIII